MTDLDELDRLLAAATPGPWQHGIAGTCNLVHFDGDDIRGVDPNRGPNLNLIAALRNNAADLIAELRPLRELEAAIIAYHEMHRETVRATPEVRRYNEALTACRAAREAGR
jgi:hypothetical protein